MDLHFETLLHGYILQAAAVFCLAILLAYYLAMWSKYGRDPRVGKIVPLTEPPEGLTPAAMRCLRENDLDSRGIAALLCSLAIKGYLRIICTDGAWSLSRRDAAVSPTLNKLQSTLADGQPHTVMTLADQLDLSPKGVRQAAAELTTQGIPVEITGDAMSLRASGGTLTKTLPPMDREEALLFDHLLAKHTEIKLTDKHYQFIKDGITPAEESAKAQYGATTYFLANRRIINAGWLLSLLLAVLLAVLALQPGVKELFGGIEGEGDRWVAFLVGGLFTLVGFSGVTYLAIPTWIGLGKPGNGCGGVVTAILITIFFGMFFLGGMLGALAGSITWGLYYLCALIINRIFSPLLKAYTPVGRALLDQVEGFRQYLCGAGGQQRKFLAAPEMTPQLFERYLPFAIVLDAEHAWAKQYVAAMPAATRGYQPSWCEWDLLNEGNLPWAITQLAENFSTAIESASTPPKRD